ncbi:hypothetical protein TWF569_004853 [Orbilia oligospora]|uniref:Spindle pole body component n=1 Tax=Orbilia oligospora TaxID=2813651 RepID=A0A7C8K1L9_ORBOL|nr:hypothetical protein TWF706_010950 [Orbilia oligospora]KAF3131791.1 hypothetical protein TWF703_007510 [Orbilia oligospora]KAF3149940.1 hypothetical protein TWF569_004853 [Orbilia oligospora]
MTANSNINRLTSTLINAVTGIPSNTENHNLCLSFALKSYKHHKFPSTNPFDIVQSLEGLEEKFRINDNDVLADELATRARILQKVQEQRQQQKQQHQQQILGFDFGVKEGRDKDGIDLGGIDKQYIPDILRLILALSTLPVENANTSLEDLEELVQSQLEIREAKEKKLAAEEAAAREADRDDELWEIPDFAETSSDDDWADDEFTRQAEVKEKLKERKRAARRREEAEDAAPPAPQQTIEDYIRVAQASTAHAIELAQYWKRQSILPADLAQNFVSYGLAQNEISELWSIGEVYVIREVIFALYGLAGSLYKFQDDGSINVLTTYILPTTSPGSLIDILDHFAAKAVILQKLRTFCKSLERRCLLAKSSPTTHDAIAPAQSFVEAIQSAISEWELDVLAKVEEQYVHQGKDRKDNAMVSLLQLQRELDPSLEKFSPLYEIIAALERGLAEGGLSEPAARVSFHLELLFKKSCEAESNGRLDIFRFLRGIFLKCLRIYLRPIAKWMELGDLREADGLGAFFIHLASDGDEEDEGDDSEASQLAKLWRGRYVLDQDERGTIVAPSFIREYGRKIFVVGKSVLFLRRLGEDVAGFMGKEVGLKEALDELNELTGKEGRRSLVSFNDALLVAMAEWVDKTHRDVSTRLRDILYYECGLWDSLNGMVDVYFMRDGFAMAGFCGTLFERIEKGMRWDDRFLLTELVQSVYSENRGVEIGRLAVKTRRVEGDKKGVKALGMLDIEYRLTWPLLNIFTVESIAVCKKVWGFLLMIRRSRSALEKMKMGRAGRGKYDKGEKVAYTVRWRLLTFISLLQAFLVDLVIQPQVESLKKKLEGAEDIDEMIDVQEEHFGRIAELCLVSGRMAPLYQAVVSVMELAVVLAQSQKGRKKLEVPVVREKRVVDFRKSVRKDVDSEDEEVETEDDEDDDDGSDDDGDGDEDEIADRIRRKKIEKENRKRQMLGRLSAQAQKLIMFLTTGLRSMARAGVYPDTVEVLAERLEMGVLVEEEEDYDDY